jgi:hypothetical protein
MNLEIPKNEIDHKVACNIWMKLMTQMNYYEVEGRNPCS